MCPVEPRIDCVTRMKMPTLATVFLDNEPVGLMGDPRPLVSKIVVAAGKRPDSVDVLRASSAGVDGGRPVRLDETIDRTADPTVPIYLMCVAKRAKREVATNFPHVPKMPPDPVPPQYLDVGGPVPQPHMPDGLPPLPDGSGP